MDQATRREELEKENRCLKWILADPALDMATVQDVAKGTFYDRLDAVGRWNTLANMTVSRSVAHVGCSRKRARRRYRPSPLEDEQRLVSPIIGLR